MSKLVQLRLPPAFILERALPTGAELAYGFREGWVAPEDVIEVARGKRERGVKLWPAEEKLALSSPSDLDHIVNLVSELEFADEPVERRARLWLFLALAWLLQHRSEYEDPFRTIEMLYADFDYPEEIQTLLRFMPPGPRDVPGINGLEGRWRDYVDRLGGEYRERD